jgi:hypothetical protein
MKNRGLNFVKECAQFHKELLTEDFIKVKSIYTKRISKILISIVGLVEKHNATEILKLEGELNERKSVRDHIQYCRDAVCQINEH